MADVQRSGRVDMSRVSMVVNMVLVLAGLLYVIVVTVSGYNGRLWYKLSVMLLMVGYSLLFNIAALYNMQAFDNMTKQQGRSYFGYMIFDAVELCFLAMFVVNAGDFDEPFHYISLGVFLVLTIPRHMLYHDAVDEVKEKEKRRIAKKNSSAAVQSTKERFEEPKLREDRFVSMKLEGYVGGRSVDEAGNISPDVSMKKE